MKINKKIIKTAIFISISYGLVVSLLVGVLATSYTAFSPVTNQPEVSFGITAVKSYINNFGSISWLVSLIPSTIIIITAIFGSCLLQGYYQDEKA